MGKHFYVVSFSDGLFLSFKANEAASVLIFRTNMRKAPEFTGKYTVSRILGFLSIFVKTEIEKQFINIKSIISKVLTEEQY